MKKLFLILAATFMATTTWAQSQQLITVKGKTKDGKSINVQYYKGTAQDYIESVKYQLVDELKTENKNKQNTINDLQSQLNKANKRIENLIKQVNESGSAANTDCDQQLSQKQSEIDQLNQQLSELNALLNASRAENEKLKRQLDSIKVVNVRLSQNKNRPAKHPIIGVEGSMGSVFLSNNSLNNPWEKALSWNKQVAVYFGTDRLIKGLPLSVEVGVGFRSLPMLAKLNHYELPTLIEDQDGDSYRPIFDNCSEKITLNCLEVPIRLCIGQPSKKLSLYTKVGVTPSITLSSSLTEGAYSRKGYYPDWNVTLEDIDELDFFGEGGEGKTKVNAKKFNLWGNAAFGAYVPLTSSMLFNVGAKLDYPILKTGSFDPDSRDNYILPDGGLTTYNGRMLVTSLQAGLVYTLK